MNEVIKNANEWFGERNLKTPDELIAFYENNIDEVLQGTGGEDYYYIDFYEILDGDEAGWIFGIVEAGLFLVCYNENEYSITDDSYEKTFEYVFKSLKELQDAISENNNTALSTYIKYNNYLK